MATKKSKAKKSQEGVAPTLGLGDLGKVARVLLRRDTRPVVLDAETKRRFEFLLRTSLEISALNPLAFIGYDEVAEKFNVCENTIRAWIADKNRRRPFPAPIGHADDGRLVVFPAMLIELYIASIIVDGYGLDESLFFDFDALSEQIERRIGRGAGFGLHDVKVTRAGQTGPSVKAGPLATEEPSTRPGSTPGGRSAETHAPPAGGLVENLEPSPALFAPAPVALSEPIRQSFIPVHRIVQINTRPLFVEIPHR
jgi:hypothetical protein